MAPRIVPGGCDTWEHVFEFEKPPRQRYLSDLTDLAWQRLRHLLVRPHPRGAAMPRVALARVGRRDLVRQPYRLHLGNGAPRLRRLLVGDPQALPALDPRRHLRPCPRRAAPPGPPCPRPQPEPRPGRSNPARSKCHPFVVLEASTAPEDRRHQTPRRRGHRGPAGGRAGHRSQRAGSGGGAPAARPSPLPLPGARPSVGRPGLHRQRRAGREQDPAVHDPRSWAGSSPRAALSSSLSPGCTAADASSASTSRPHWPMRPWSS
jgi:hypothetical protein